MSALAGSDGKEVRSLAVGGAQLTQGGGDSTGMPLSVGRSRPDQTATIQNAESNERDPASIARHEIGELTTAEQLLKRFPQTDPRVKDFILSQARSLAGKTALPDDAPVGLIPDERAAFEEWYEADAMPAESDWFRRDPNDSDDYLHVSTAWSWHGWQGRASTFTPKRREPVYYAVREGEDWRLWPEAANPRPPTPEDAPFKLSGRYGDWGGVHFLAVRFGDGNSTRIWDAAKGWLDATSEEKSS